MPKNRLVLVTGASSGIGASISKKFCIERYQVILSSRSKEKLIPVYKELLDLGFNPHVIPCDVTSENEVKKLYRESSKIGFVDCIINNAGLGKFSKIQDVTTSDWDQQINTNLKGSFLISREFVRDMIKNKEGKIIFINSVAGKFGYPYSSAYVASKFGLKGLADSMRNELREFNIKVISIHPGSIDTQFWDKSEVDFPRSDMLSSKDIADTVFHAANAPHSTVLEEVVVRRTAGDF